MQPRRNLTFFAILAAAILIAGQARAQDLNSVLTKLDAAAQNFHSTSAHVEWDTVQTDPIPDKDVMTGMAYYERTSKGFEMSAHLTQHDGQPAANTYIISNGICELSETGKEKDAKPYPQASKYEDYLRLGFGASGHDLQEKWNIKYLGTEMIDGKSTDKLELVAKDPNVRKNLLKVTVWLDTARAVSLQQKFDEADGTYRLCHYTDLVINEPLPKNAFRFSK